MDNMPTSEAAQTINDQFEELILRLLREGFSPGMIAFIGVHNITEFSIHTTKSHPTIITNLLAAIMCQFEKFAEVEEEDPLWPVGGGTSDEYH